MLLLRQALIGGSQSQSAIVLNAGGAKDQARLLHIDRLFWLEPLPAGAPIYVDDDPCPPRSLRMSERRCTRRSGSRRGPHPGISNAPAARCRTSQVFGFVQASIRSQRQVLDMVSEISGFANGSE